jgi:uncharacterized protein (TIGR03437 family)
MRELHYQTLALILLAAGSALAQSPVPAVYQTTYTELQGHLSDFAATIPSGKTSNVLWSGDLLGANANAGLSLLKNPTGVMLQLDLMHALGQRSVVVNMAFPVVDYDFYVFNGDPGDYQPMVDYYTTLANHIHSLGMKMVVESADLFLGEYSANSGFNLTGYYASLSASQYVAERLKNLLTVAQVVQPDFINLNSEPDTDAELTGQTGLYSTSTAYAGMVQQLITGLKNAGVTIPLGAGVGTWLDDGNASDWVSALLNAGIDYLDLHVYPVNCANCLSALTTYTNMATQAGKPTAISEAWLLKESDAEYVDPPSGASKSGGETYYGRDPFSFWAPLDQQFLATIQKFADAENLIYISPFWTRYFWAYLDYDLVANLTPQEISTEAQTAADAAVAASQMTSTATSYKTDTGGILQIPLVSAADFLTTPQAPQSLIAIFGTNLSNGSENASSLPLPTTLDNTTATVTDSTGKQADLLLLYVSPTQINAAVPSGLANGVAVVNITNQGTLVSQANVVLHTVAPALFTANQTGSGVPVGTVATANGSGSLSYQNVVQGSGVGNYTPAPINLGGASDSSVLVLYGSGIRGATSLGNVTATVSNATLHMSLDVLYAGPCDPSQFVGLDQVNISLPSSLAGAGQVSLTLTVNGVGIKPVTLDFQ